MSTNQFDFASALEATLLREIPGCAKLRAVERLSGGASMETYRLSVSDTAGQQYDLCLRRGAGGLDSESEHASGLATEALAIKAARQAGVAEPEVLYVLRASDGVGTGFVMEWLDGVTLGARIVRAPELDQIRPGLAYQCGQELARIHGIDLVSTGLGEVLREITPAQYLAETWQRYQAFPTAQPMIDFTARWLGENMVTEFSPTLVHNDFRNGNLMVSPTQGLIAVLDWESVHIGDPMRDLGWICTNSWRFGRRDLPVGGFGTYEDLVAGYEAEAGAKVDPERVRYWEVFGSFWWAVGCLSMAEHYRTGPDATVERPAIGRRSSECQVDCVNLLIPGPVELLPAAQQVLADPTLAGLASAGSASAGAASAGPASAGPSQPDPSSAGSASAGPTPAGPASVSADMPALDELLVSVRDFLHEDVMANTTARTNFMARVAGNTLNTVRRELLIGPQLRERENALLGALLGSQPSSSQPSGSQPSSSQPSSEPPTDLATRINQQRWELVRRLRDGSMSLDAPGLQSYLRESVVHQVAIDQPTYSGFIHATFPNVPATAKVAP